MLERLFSKIYKNDFKRYLACGTNISAGSRLFYWMSKHKIKRYINLLTDNEIINDQNLLLRVICIRVDLESFKLLWARAVVREVAAHAEESAIIWVVQNCKFGPNPWHKDEREFKSARLEILKLLLQERIINIHHFSIEWVIFKGSFEVFKLFWQNDEVREYVASNCYHAMLNAIQLSNLTIFKLLWLEPKVRAIVALNYNNVLYIACVYNLLEVVKLLWDEPSVRAYEAANNYSGSLQHAIDNEKFALVNFFWQDPLVRVDAVANNNFALHHAVSCNSYEMIKLLWQEPMVHLNLNDSMLKIILIAANHKDFNILHDVLSSKVNNLNFNDIKSTFLVHTEEQKIVYTYLAIEMVQNPNYFEYWKSKPCEQQRQQLLIDLLKSYQYINSFFKNTAIEHFPNELINLIHQYSHEQSPSIDYLAIKMSNLSFKGDLMALNLIMNPIEANKYTNRQIEQSFLRSYKPFFEAIKLPDSMPKGDIIKARI